MDLGGPPHLMVGELHVTVSRTENQAEARSKTLYSVYIGEKCLADCTQVSSFPRAQFRNSTSYCLLRPVLRCYWLQVQLAPGRSRLSLSLRVHHQHHFRVHHLAAHLFTCTTAWRALPLVTFPRERPERVESVRQHERSFAPFRSEPACPYRVPQPRAGSRRVGHRACRATQHTFGAPTCEGERRQRSLW